LRPKTQSEFKASLGYIVKQSQNVNKDTIRITLVQDNLDQKVAGQVVKNMDLFGKWHYRIC
jgi:hypothetical protein